MRSFAQDADSIAWIGATYKVRVRSLLTGQTAIVGSAAPALGSGPAPALAVAGTRVVWSKSEGGNSPETSLWTSTLGGRSTGIDLFAGNAGDPGGLLLTGVAGDGPTLLYGRTFETCSPPWPVGPCQSLLAQGGVSFVTGQYQAPSIGGIPPPDMIAFAAHDPQSGQISQGMLAVAPAVSPLLTSLYDAPRVAENGPVQVYRFLNGVAPMSSVAPQGYVKAVALSFRQLVVLVQRANGPRLIERYNPKSGAIIGTTPVPSSTAFGLSVSSSGIVYRVGSKIYLLGANGTPKLVWKAKGTPIGLSIEDRRIAWAVNFKGRGRVVTLTLR